MITIQNHPYAQSARQENSRGVAKIRPAFVAGSSYELDNRQHKGAYSDQREKQYETRQDVLDCRHVGPPDYVGNVIRR
jgi:hypothetical protein